jgi:hypothetical protein
VRVQQVRDLRVALPASAAFLAADLTRDPTADLAHVENERPPAPSPRHDDRD